MARSKGGILQDLTTMPWWVSVVMVAVVYLGLRFVFPLVLSQGVIALAIGKGAATAAPWFGLLFLLPVPFSLMHSGRRRKILDTQKDLSTIRSLHWSDFELMVGEAFRRQGYSIEERGGSAPDGGVDLMLHKDGKMTIVQCKHWKVQKIGVSVVRELFGVMVASQANRGILVSSGQFTSEAEQFARGKPIELMDGEALHQLIPALSMTDKVEPSLYGIAKSTTVSNLCPDCGSKMIKRVAQKGQNAGTVFWGCSMYPKCRGTRPI